MGVLLALAAALGYGLSDFVGGVAARRSSTWPVALLSQVGGLAGAVVLAAAFAGDPTGGDLGWGALAGIGAGMGTVFLYRGFAGGRMGVVAPVSAVGAAILPVIVGVAVGERPAVLVWLGIVLALPAIWLVARVPDEGRSTDESDAAALRDGVLAGVGFGLLFVAMGQVPEEAGYWPLATGQVTALVAIVVGALLAREAWVPSRRTELWGIVAGILASAAVLSFLLSSQRGLLAVAAVLTSLYPAFTVVLATAALREHVYRTQAVGLVLSGCAVALVAAG
ncbi:DMT family transporter [Nocardioides panacisoli]|uniref:DMT family transporter n=1 Tax=Nocardioides panacisoli TaxID=627624 RepID=A0ABP7I8H0_9ACTN